MRCMRGLSISKWMLYITAIIGVKQLNQTRKREAVTEGWRTRVSLWNTLES
jgi:hypothetical protein